MSWPQGEKASKIAWSHEFSAAAKGDGELRMILMIAVAGALGAVSRYAMSQWTYRLLGEPTFPYGTMVVNLLGCFALGFVAHFSLTSSFLTPDLKIAVMIGFLGAFTTFSTFSYETLRLLEGSNWPAALANVIVSVVLGLAAVWGGLTAARTFVTGT